MDIDLCACDIMGNAAFNIGVWGTFGGKPLRKSELVVALCSVRIYRC